MTTTTLCLTDNQFKRLQELLANSPLGMEAMDRPVSVVDGDLHDLDGTPLFERMSASKADANYVAAIINLMPRILGELAALHEPAQPPPRFRNQQGARPMTEPKRDPFQHRQAWTVCNVLSFYGYPDEHREALRRIAATPEFAASVIAESMVKMERGADKSLARAFAEANTNLVMVATKILDDLEAECRAKDYLKETDR